MESALHPASSGTRLGGCGSDPGVGAEKAEASGHFDDRELLCQSGSQPGEASHVEVQPGQAGGKAHRVRIARKQVDMAATNRLTETNCIDGQ